MQRQLLSSATNHLHRAATSCSSRMVAGAEVGVGEAEADAEEAVVNMNTRAVDRPTAIT